MSSIAQTATGKSPLLGTARNDEALRGIRESTSFVDQSASNPAAAQGFAPDLFVC